MVVHLVAPKNARNTPSSRERGHVDATNVVAVALRRSPQLESAADAEVDLKLCDEDEQHHLVAQSALVRQPSVARVVRAGPTAAPRTCARTRTPRDSQR